MILLLASAWFCSASRKACSGKGWSEGGRPLPWRELPFVTPCVPLAQAKMVFNPQDNHTKYFLTLHFTQRTMAQSSKVICPKTPGWAAARWGLYLTHRACTPACWLKSCGSHTTGKCEEAACMCMCVRASSKQEGAAWQLRGSGGL